MTPNKPVIAEEARKLLTGDNSKLENAMLDMVSRLADVVTYNAEAMNKLVRRVDELEKLLENDKPSVKPVFGHYLQELLKQPHVQRVKCVKSESHLWQEGKDYPVLVNTTDNMHTGVRSETGELREGSLSLFVEVMPQKEPFELTFNRPSVYSTPLGVSFKDSAKQLFAEQLCHSQFLAVTRMFMGLPTVQLIHPRSL